MLENVGILWESEAMNVGALRAKGTSVLSVSSRAVAESWRALNDFCRAQTSTEQIERCRSIRRVFPYSCNDYVKKIYH